MSSQISTQQIVQSNGKANIWDRWVPLTKASNVEGFSKSWRYYADSSSSICDVESHRAIPREPYWLSIQWRLIYATVKRYGEHQFDKAMLKIVCASDF